MIISIDCIITNYYDSNYHKLHFLPDTFSYFYKKSGLVYKSIGNTDILTYITSTVIGFSRNIILTDRFYVYISITSKSQMFGTIKRKYKKHLFSGVCEIYR